jgi:hypothetical protein
MSAKISSTTILTESHLLIAAENVIVEGPARTAGGRSCACAGLGAVLAASSARISEDQSKSVGKCLFRECSNIRLI